MNYLALFEMEPIGENDALEANGRVYHFCSETCWGKFDNMPDGYYSPGESPDAIEGTVCDHCGGELIL